MSEIKIPALANNTALSEFVFQEPSQIDAKIDLQLMEVACIDVVGKLENLLARANQLSPVDFVDESATVGRKMLGELKLFCDTFLFGDSQKQAQEEIGKAKAITHTYDEILKTRSFLNAFVRTFWEVDEKPEIAHCREKLGQALARAFAATFYHAISILGVESDLGKQIDQSTAVFLTELQQNW